MLMIIITIFIKNHFISQYLLLFFVCRLIIDIAVDIDPARIKDEVKFWTDYLDKEESKFIPLQNQMHSGIYRNRGRLFPVKQVRR